MYVMSLPLRERGLKSAAVLPVLRPAPVAPLAGAWIEIGFRCGSRCEKRSLPLRERGLKSELHKDGAYHFHVAPLAGAWIEIV